MAMRPVFLLLLASAAAPAAAQDAPPSVNDFKLPPPSQPRIDPRLQGPALRPAPVPLPTEQPTAAPPRQRPSIAQPNAPTSAPTSETQSSARRTAPDRTPSTAPGRVPTIRPAARPTTREQVRPGAIPTGEIAPPVPSQPPAFEPAPTMSGGDAAAQTPTTPTVAPTGSSQSLPAGERSVWPLVLLGLAVLMALGAVLVALRRGRRSERRPAEPRAPTAATPPAPPVPAPVPTPRVKPVAAPAPAPLTNAAHDPADGAMADGPLRLLFEPMEAHATPFGTTLKARITVANAGDAPITDAALRLAIAGAGPEGDAKMRVMLAGGAEGIAEPLADLAPGEVRTLDRSLRVGAREFRPIQLADRTIFVPQVAFDLTGQSAGAPVRLSGACLVGRRPTQTGAKMGPFRLDLGPRHYRDLMQRPHDPGPADALARAS